MKYRKSTLVHGLLIALSFSMQGSAFAAESTQSRPVARFDAVDLSGAIDLVVVAQGPQDLRLKGEQDSLAKVVTEVKDGTLHVRQKEQGGSIFNLFDFFNRKRGKVKCEVTASALKAIKTAGACSIEAADLTGEGFALDASGASSAKLKGRIKHLSLNLSGAGTVDAELLKADDAEVDLSGASEVVVNAANTLKIDASGACKVTYVGKPRIQQDLSGACSVRSK